MTADVENNISKKDVESVVRVDPFDEERKGVIHFRVIKNDQIRENLIFLTSLKNIFQKQLPKMPKEYVSRLIYDRNHDSLILVKHPKTVVAGITFRLFPSDSFGEIVFCAVTSSEQVKGYGSFMMNYLKDYVKSVANITHFLTYADNYAVGYFKKQGFSKTVNLSKSVWGGKIKDYDGGTLMECKMIPKITYREVAAILNHQKQAIYERIKEKSNYYISHEGLDFHGRHKIPISEMKGILEAGWTPEMGREYIKPNKSTMYEFLRPLLTELQNHASAWPFLEPVSPVDVPDYRTVIKYPMDLGTIDKKLERDEYDQLESFRSDVQLVFDNCRTYNLQHTPYYKCANMLEEYFLLRLKARLSRE